jgi:MOSC domain-containing protein YiiM
MALARGSLLSVNVGRIRHFEFEGHPAVSAIWKTPITWRVDVSGVNLAGDDQADRAAHGGPDKAVYAYASEDLLWWTQELGRPVEPGEMGENFTIEGIDVSAALVGERWEVGSAVFEVSEPRVPCWRLGARMEDKLFPRRFAQAGRPGAYLRIVTEGDVGAGDEVRVIRRPDHAVTVGDIFRIFTRDRHDAARLLTVSQMSLGWRRWAEDRRKGSEG